MRNIDWDEIRILAVAIIALLLLSFVAAYFGVDVQPNGYMPMPIGSGTYMIPY